MDTRTEIIRLGDSLIREKGYNAFSFTDISKQLNIKNASVHYHFPTKTALGLAIVQEHNNRLEQLKTKTESKDPVEKLKAFLTIYSVAKSENKICIVGSLATDFYTVEHEIQNELKKLADNILEWVIEILKDGKNKKVFRFDINERTKALMIITNMLAAVQLTRLTNEQDFQEIKENIIKDLTQQS
ncbi:TetR/AcrR family transcriptional regulator [Solitalea canadensis]|uniref:Transcriptional regulator n=1 Tax=Solitalea canadensis (strain ATCC 29591 / DSM 3403 / JCM 21819 / LMG 8368 / NBRC 15130 / NCIMB 12057 / USAM 9D) TaxID=929556 RepID=H8KLC3_SOLCM|nr:TetR/AcrR family transcriptional regulator [Solitalea canadensis]AFD08625.1 transcriptional regulator [Solitalea canadensis DSM 3403]